MHNKSISPSYAEDQVSGLAAGAAGRRRTPPPRLIYTTTVAQKQVSYDVLLFYSSNELFDSSQVTWSACIMPYGRSDTRTNANVCPVNS
jgi:hypothetical protein